MISFYRPSLKCKISFDGRVAPITKKECDFVVNGFVKIHKVLYLMKVNI